MSAIQTFLRCPKKFELQYVQGYLDKGPQPKALVDGIALHSYLERAAKYTMGLPLPPSPKPNKAMWDRAVAYLQAHPLPSIDVIVSADDPYFLDFEGVRLRATFDMLLDWGDKLEIRDFKTQAYEKIPDFKCNFQRSFYCWFIRRLPQYLDYPCEKIYFTHHRILKKVDDSTPLDRQFVVLDSVWSEEEDISFSTDIRVYLTNMKHQVDTSVFPRIYSEDGGWGDCTGCGVRQLCLATRKDPEVSLDTEGCKQSGDHASIK